MDSASSLPTAHDRIEDITRKLCEGDSLRKGVSSAVALDKMPSLADLAAIMNKIRSVVFPGYFNSNYPYGRAIYHHIAADLDDIHMMLSEQIWRGFNFACAEKGTTPPSPEESRELAMALLDKLPEIRRKLADDAQAGYEGDPAATSPGETIFCYPSMYTMTHHRIAHELYRLGVPLIPRIIAEMAHSHTGIDIHPGAQIGNSFFIDHATGVVIGETCIIGDNCRIYQGVTLGALSFPKNDDGSLVKGIPRHPILKDNVTVYAGATILGRVTIGSGAVIGGNVWITEDVPDGAKVTQKKH